MYPTVTSLFIIIASLASPTGLTKPVKNLTVFGGSHSDTGIWGSLIWPAYVGDYLDITLPRLVQHAPTILLLGSGQMRDVTKKNNGTLGQLDPSTTVCALWIDVRSGRLLTGDQAPGVTLFDTIKRPVNWVKTMYDSRARNFLFQNMVPLHRSPIYKKDAYLTRHRIIPNNRTEMSIFMESQVTSGNTLSGLLLRVLAPTMHGAHIGIFDSYSL